MEMADQKNKSHAIKAGGADPANTEVANISDRVDASGGPAHGVRQHASGGPATAVGQHARGNLALSVRQHPGQHVGGGPAPAVGGGPAPAVDAEVGREAHLEVQLLPLGSTSSKCVVRRFEPGADLRLTPWALPQWAAPMKCVSWKPHGKSDITELEMDNQFMINISCKNIGAVFESTLRVYGADTVEDVCAGFNYYLRVGKVIEPNQIVSAVFTTTGEEVPLHIPSGTMMCELYKTNANGTGTGVDFSCSIYEYEVGHRFLISPVLGHWYLSLPLKADDEPQKAVNAAESSDSEKESDDSDEDDKSAKTPKKEVPAATKSQKAEPKTPAGTNTLFMGNISWNADIEQVMQFFAEVAEVVEVRLSIHHDGKPKGFGHVEFATAEDASKALQLNGQDFLGRAVRLAKAAERVASAPRTRDGGSFGKPSAGPSLSVFVRGFDASQQRDEINSALREHFSKCGEVSRVSVPVDYDSGESKGIAYLDFSDESSFNKALELSGSDLGGFNLHVTKANPKGHFGGGGRSGGRDGGGRFGRSGGRDGGRRGGGRGFQSRQGAGTASAGKKTIFGDD